MNLGVLQYTCNNPNHLQQQNGRMRGVFHCTRLVNAKRASRAAILTLFRLFSKRLFKLCRFATALAIRVIRPKKPNDKVCRRVFGSADCVELFGHCAFSCALRCFVDEAHRQRPCHGFYSILKSTVGELAVALRSSGVKLLLWF
jgi:hypothetical protein